MLIDTPEAPRSETTTRRNMQLEARLPWYRGRALTQEQRAQFKARSRASREARALADAGLGPKPVHPIYEPRFHPECLMPKRHVNGLRALSLFSGGGGLDLGFDLAGFSHVASYEILPVAGETLRRNRPSWTVCSGYDGDVTRIDWCGLKGDVDVIHGGPPCQPFSVAGYQMGHEDIRDMFPEFVRAVLEIQPRAFVAENVPALASNKFRGYVERTILGPLGSCYDVAMFKLSADWFGVPQNRTRVVFVGFLDKRVASRYTPPARTHYSFHVRQETPSFEELAEGLPACMGAREALGLPNIGFDLLAPTLRSGFTGPRKTTSVVNSVAALRIWRSLGIWPHGVAASRESARKFVASDGNFRLSVPDCALLQGFPAEWTFSGAVYAGLGQIGNSVVPPMAYQLAVSVAEAF
jgi:DNA (cytosine-5)-methyltransferase 1